MRMPQSLCLMNDSFPPLIDGVANAVVNYACAYQRYFGKVVVATPYNPAADDNKFPFPVIRYRSFNTARLLRYRAGYPFSVECMRKLKRAKVELIHCHCPFMSAILARSLRYANGAPIVLTYHTKFDVDIARTVPTKALQERAVRLVLSNINACDEVWVVSRGAGENLRALGYQGECVVMENGVDYPKGKAAESEVRAVCGEFELPAGIPVYLFVGRMMWYKGLKLAFDSLRRLLDAGKDFRLVLIGDGQDRPAMEEYAAGCGLMGKCLFLGAVRDRERLRAWYSRADLFLFPSSYDTNGLVVREAAAAGLASVLIAGSCAAEGVKDGFNGFLCEENTESMTELLLGLCSRREFIRQVGEHALDTLYLSWEESVSRAAGRYAVVLEKAATGELERKRRLSDKLIHATTGMMEGVEALREFREDPMEELRAMYEWQKAHLGGMTDGIWRRMGNMW